MDSMLAWLFGTARFVPHGVCLLWRPDLVAIHVVSDSLIALSYFAIPAGLWWFVQRRTDLEPAHKRMAQLFAAFIILCGLTHVAGVVTLWYPYYGIQALIKLATAVVSVITALALPPLLPRLLTIPSPRALQEANAALARSVAAHEVTLRELEAARAGLARDVAERTEDLRIANARFQAALANSRVTLFEQDDSLRYTWVHNPPFGLDATEMLGRTEADIMAPGTADQVQALKREALLAGEPRHAELNLTTNRGEGWFDLRVEPTRLRDGRPGLVASSTDVTDQKRRQQHLRTVMHELNHRSKNLLTMVQSIARQTARGLDVPEAFQQRLTERLRALADTHDVLVREEWQSADLRSVVETQLKPQLATYAGRIDILGETVALPAEAAHYVGLAVHELGANAVKYGALSRGEGRVEIDWRVEPSTEVSDGPGRLRLSWREVNGPVVLPSERRGFGRSILEVLTPRAMSGHAELSFAPGGVCWVLTAPMKAGQGEPR